MFFEFKKKYAQILCAADLSITNNMWANKNLSVI